MLLSLSSPHYHSQIVMVDALHHLVNGLLLVYALHFILGMLLDYIFYYLFKDYLLKALKMYMSTT